MNTSFPTGAFLVNMGVTPQTVANSLKPYGLVYDLVQNYNVPVSWVIHTGKGKDGVDFIHNGVTYRGGSFVVPADYRTAVVNARIAYWQGLGVVGNTSVSALTLPVVQTFYSMPKWTMDATNGSIASGYLTNAGIPSSALNWLTPAQLTCCNDLFVMPHADPTWSTHQNLVAWNQSCKGSIWAACHAVSALENMFNTAAPTQQANFLAEKSGTASGGGPYAENALILWGNHDGGTPPYSYDHPGDPVMQFLGTIDVATQNGSEQIYMPKTSWRNTTKIGAWDPTQPDVPGTSPGKAAIIAYGPGFGNSANGNVMYEAGHSHNKATLEANIAAQRAFMNFSFWASKEKQLQVSVSGTTAHMNGGVSIPVSATVSSAVPSGPYTYLWSSSCGGTFANATAGSTTFTPPSVTSNTNCVLSVKVSDACGRTTNYSEAIIIVPGPRPPVAANDVVSLEASCSVQNPSVSVYPLENDSDPDGDILTITQVTGSNGSWSFNAATGEVIYQPTANFTGAATATYTVCADAPDCATATITVNVGNPDSNGCYPGKIYSATGTTVGSTQTNNSVTNPANALGDPNYDAADNTTYAVINNAADWIIVDMGTDLAPPLRDSLEVYFASGTEGTSVTMKVEWSTSAAGPFSTPVNVATSSLLEGAVSTFAIPTTGLRYVRLSRFSGTADLYIDGIVGVNYECVSALPVLASDDAIVREDEPHHIDVLDNDGSPSGLALYVKEIVSQPTNGTVSINTDQSITYTPDADFSGTDNFIYRACDEEGFCSQATVNVKVNDDGCPSGQYAPLNYGSPVTVTFSTSAQAEDAMLNSERNTRNYGGSTVISVGKKTTKRRRIAWKPVNFLTEIPSNAVIDNASFTLTQTAGDVTTLSLAVHEVTQSWLEGTQNDATSTAGTSWVNRFVTPSTTAWTSAGGTISASPVATATASRVSTASNGSKTTFNVSSLVEKWQDNRSATSPRPDELGLLVKQAGNESVDKRIEFGASENSTATNRPVLSVTYYVPAACTTISNHAPLAMPDYASTNAATPVSVNVASNDADPENQTLTVALAGIPTGGSASVAGNVIQFTPTNTFNGTASLLYSISDGSLKDTARVSIEVGNAAPLAVSDVAAVTTNSTANVIHVLANDQNPDGPNPMALSIVEFPSNGSVTINAQNKLEYTTTPGFIGKDTIVYKICETVASGPCDLPDCDTTYLAINIQNQPPTVTPDMKTTNTCDPVLTDVLANDSDPEGGSLVIANLQLTTAMAGNVALTASNKILFQPGVGFNGTANITYDVCDLATPALCTASTLSVLVTTSPAVNDPPVLQNDLAENIIRGDVAYIPVLQNDSDPEGTALTLTPFSASLTPAGSGTLSVDGNTVVFTPSAGFIGAVSFQYEACDLAPEVFPGCPLLMPVCTTATVTLNVVNQAPQPVDDMVCLAYNSTSVISPLANDNEPDHDKIILQAGGATNRGGTMVLVTNGTPTDYTDDYFNYTPPTGYTGIDTFSYQVCDDVAAPNALCATAVIYIKVAQPVDLELTKEVAVMGPLTIGGNITFTLKVANNSTVNATGVSVFDQLSSSYQYVSQTGTGLYDASTGLWAIGNVNAMSEVTKTITVTVLNVSSLKNTAYIYTQNEPDVDSRPNNTVQNEDDYDSVTPPLLTDVSITKSDGKTTYTPGTSSTYTIVATNLGPVGVTGATMKDMAPSGTSISAWSAVPAGGATGNASGTGNISETIDLPVNATMTYTVTLQINAGVTGNLTNVATIHLPEIFMDSDTTNNKATDVNSPSPEADLRIVKTSVSQFYIPNSIQLFKIKVTNNGPSDASGALVRDTATAGTIIQSWSAAYSGTASGPASGSGNLNESIVLPVGDSAIFTLSVLVSDTMRRDLVNIAYVTPPSGTTDPDLTNNKESETDVVRPDAVQDSKTTPHNTPFSGTVSPNDVYKPGSAFDKVSDPKKGTVSMNTDGTFTYTPNTGFTGIDTFTYRVCLPNPNSSVCDTARVIIAVGPDAENDAYTTPHNTPVNQTVISNDTYPTGSTFGKVTNPKHGTATVNTDGTFTYTPATGFTGIDTFTYKVCLPSPNSSLCDTASVIIVVGPDAKNDAFNTPFNTPVSNTVVTNDTYPSGSGFSKVSDPKNGIVTVNTDGTFTYTPNTGFTGIDTFTYSICLPAPNMTLCDTARVVITVGPVAQDDSYTTPFNTPVSNSLGTNDNYPSGSTFEKTTSPKNGMATVNFDGTFTYTPNTGFTGIDTFTYRVCLPSPNMTLCDTASVIIVVGPDAKDDAFNTPFNTPVSKTVTTNDAYPAGSTFGKVSDPKKGSVMLNTDGSFTYTPNTGFTGIDTFTYSVCLPAPNNTICDTASVIIVVGPDAQNDFYTTRHNSPVNKTVVTNDTYPVGSVFGKVANPKKGAVTVNVDGTFTYSPNSGFTGIDTFTYSVCLASPNSTLCDTARVVIVVGPKAVDDAFTTPFNTPVSNTVVTNDTYPVGSSFTKLANPKFGMATLNADGSFTYTPNTGYSGKDTFTYHVCMPVPNQALCDTAIVIITINPDFSLVLTDNYGNINDGLICGGSQATLTATGGGTYLWSTGQTTAFITVSPSVTTAYSVTITSPSGAKDTLTATVTLSMCCVQGQITITNIVQPTCTPQTSGSVTLSGLPSTGTWTLYQTGTVKKTYTGTGSTYTVTPLTDGVYRFCVESSDGCKSQLTSPFGAIIKLY